MPDVFKSAAWNGRCSQEYPGDPRLKTISQGLITIALSVLGLSVLHAPVIFHIGSG